MAAREESGVHPVPRGERKQPAGQSETIAAKSHLHLHGFINSPAALIGAQSKRPVTLGERRGPFDSDRGVEWSGVERATDFSVLVALLVVKRNYCQGGAVILPKSVGPTF